MHVVLVSILLVRDFYLDEHFQAWRRHYYFNSALIVASLQIFSVPEFFFSMSEKGCCLPSKRERKKEIFFSPCLKRAAACPQKGKERKKEKGCCSRAIQQQVGGKI
jgi:hypothetical protein